MASDLTESSGWIALAKALGVTGLTVIGSLVGFFWTLHKHGGTLAIYLQARGAELERRVKTLEDEVQREREHAREWEARWEKERKDCDQERRDMLDKIEALDAGITALRNVVVP